MVNNQKWKRIVYDYTNAHGESLAEVIPLNDIRAHESSMDCKCIPVIKHKDNFEILVHNAFDGRDVNENGESGN